MGVVYKFKKDVVDFVVRQKAENKSLSCRTLADIVSKKFDIAVSKSSINSILQEAQLSSPVGRRSVTSKKERIFQIPSEKKKEFFKKTPDPHIPSIAAEKKFTHAEPSLGEMSPAVEKKKSSAAIDKIAKRAVSAARRMARPQPMERKFLFDHMGCIFLKAAEWDLASTNLLTELTKEQLTGFSKEDIQAASQALLYLEPFGFQTIQDLAYYAGQGLRTLHGIRAPLDFRKMETIVNAWGAMSELPLKISSEVDLVSSELAAVQIVLESGEKYYCDGNFAAVWRSNVQSEFGSSQNKILSNLSKDIINNIDPLILLSAAQTHSLTEEFSVLVASFENRPAKKIQRAVVLDETGQEIAQFTTIPSKKRHFIAGVWPWHKEFAELCQAENIEHAMTVGHPTSADKFTYTEIPEKKFPASLKVLASTLRGAVLRRFNQTDPVVVLLTNIPAPEISLEEVIFSYFLRWPNLGTSHTLRCLQGAPPHSQTPNMENQEGMEMTGFDLKGQLLALRSQLEKYCKKHFGGDLGNDLTDFMAECYKLNGYWQEDAHYTCVELALPKEKQQYQPVLAAAVQRVNESDIRTPTGQKLILTYQIP